jgi:hypothetical protein
LERSEVVRVQNVLEWLEAIDLDKSREHCKITSVLIEGFPGIKSATKGPWGLGDLNAKEKKEKKTTFLSK